MNNDKNLLSVNGAAEFLGVAPVTIRRAVREKFLTHIRIGDRILFRREDLEAFIESCTVVAERVPTRREALAQKKNLP